MMKNEVVRDYRIISLIGRGGMGEVYLAEHLKTNTKCAVKVLDRRLLDHESGGKFIERFKLEARVLAELKHTNIVGLNEFFVHEDDYCMVLEFAEGVTLREYIRGRGHLSENESLFIFRQLLDGVGYAHTRGIVHRDLKPANIMFNEKGGSVKILDFGIAKIIGSAGLTTTGNSIGTVTYMSPEQVQALPGIDHRTDIYNLGLILYEMLTGELPYNTNTGSSYAIQQAIVHNVYPDVRTKNPSVGANTAKGITQCTQKQPSDRPVTCYRLSEILDGHNTEPAPEPDQTGSSATIKEIKSDQKFNAGKTPVGKQAIDARNNKPKSGLPAGLKIFLILCNIPNGIIRLIMSVSLMKYIKDHLALGSSSNILVYGTTGYVIYCIFLWISVFGEIWNRKEKIPRLLLIIDLLVVMVISVLSVFYNDSPVDTDRWWGLIFCLIPTLLINISLFKQAEK